MSLTNITVNPLLALPNTPEAFSVTYTSTTGTAPTLAELQLDGVDETMTATPPLSYTTGVTYTYTTAALGIGEHFYRFVFDDGTGPWILEGQDNPRVAPIRITGAGVSPTSGTASTPFTFSATYQSADGSDPTGMAAVYLDNLAYPLTYVSGSSASGALYQFTTTLAAGSHTYFFVFANANDRWASPTYPATFSLTVNAGTSVAAAVGAHPAVGHVLLAPNHASDPDQSPYPEAKDALSTGVLPPSADFPND